MLCWRPPLVLYAFTAAVLAGVLPVIGRYLAGGILMGVALILFGARQIVDQRGEDDETGVW
jgi:hypothetical protein